MIVIYNQIDRTICTQKLNLWQKLRMRFTSPEFIVLSRPEQIADAELRTRFEQAKSRDRSSRVLVKFQYRYEHDFAQGIVPVYHDMSWVLL